MTRLHASIRAATGVILLGLSLGGVAVLAQGAAASAAQGAAASAAQVSPRSALPGTTVTPLVDCVADGPIEGGITARTVVFGYRNDSSVPVVTAAGTTENFLTPGTPDRGQPTTFLPGEHHGTFSVTINADNSGGIFWVTQHNQVKGFAQGGSAPACDTATTVALSAPTAAASGDFLTLTAVVSRMFLSAPDAGQVSFAIDAGTPTVVAVDANGVARAVVPAPTQGSHTVSATFVSAAGSPLLGSQAQATISVSSATGALSAAPSGFSPDNRRAFVTVSRASGIGAASVDYTTADGTASAGADYTASAGTVTLADGQLSTTISIPVADRAAGAPESTLFVLLQRATTTVDAAGATITLPAVGPTSGAGAGPIVGSGGAHSSRSGVDSVLPSGDPTATTPLSNGSDLVLMLGGALATVGGALGVAGLFKFGSSRHAHASL